MSKPKNKPVLTDLDLTVPYDFTDLCIDQHADEYDLDRVLEVAYLIDQGHAAVVTWVDDTERAYNEDVVIRNLGTVTVQTIPRSLDYTKETFWRHGWWAEVHWTQGFPFNDEVREQYEALVAYNDEALHDAVTNSNGKAQRLGLHAVVYRKHTAEKGEPTKFTLDGAVTPFIRESLGRYAAFKSWRTDVAELSYGDTRQTYIQSRLLGRGDLWDLLEREVAKLSKASLASLLDSVDTDEVIVPTTRKGGAAARTAAVEDEGPIVRRGGRKAAPAAQQALSIEDEAIVPRRRKKASA